MTAQPNYYELMGLAPDATAEEIHAAYRSLARSAHPDTGGNAGLFRLVKLAHDTLSDPASRAEYDRVNGFADDLDGLSAPADLVVFGQDQAAAGNTARARAAFTAAIAANESEWLPLAWLGLASAEQDAANLGAAERAYRNALGTGDHSVVPAALVGLGDCETQLGHPDEARLAYQQAIGTGDKLMIPSALIGIGELEESVGNPIAARAAYQLAYIVSDPEFAQIAADALADLG